MLPAPARPVIFSAGPELNPIKCDHPKHALHLSLTTLQTKTLPRFNMAELYGRRKSLEEAKSILAAASAEHLKAG